MHWDSCFFLPAPYILKLYDMFDVRAGSLKAQNSDRILLYFYKKLNMELIYSISAHKLVVFVVLTGFVFPNSTGKTT